MFESCQKSNCYQKSYSELLEHVDGIEGNVQFLNFAYSISAVTGSGLIKVEGHGISSSFFPVMVAEDDVCTEICTFESEIELAMTDPFP
ncbi:squamosa promoter-binding-like protein 6 [Olea europaea var. sylvestris]|uniref:squamosa promoter-binding-like protein 6 n=1 Tax=Olea europaea var. sylvestris TaxID=158386 RepID=UPI000C1CED13|nr:squamosa promoter-binding-like protein 6 [Olea europaea var. sylvestris]